VLRTGTLEFVNTKHSLVECNLLDGVRIIKDMNTTAEEWIMKKWHNSDL